MYSKFNSDNFDYLKFFFDTIEKFGGKGRSGDKYVRRVNVGSGNSTFPDKGAYFGCISEDEEDTGVYSDLCIVVFPSNELEDVNDRWIVTLAVGSLGFKNDYSIVSLPGTRRLFSRHLEENKVTSNSFIKNDFLDIESQDGFKNYCENNDIPETLNNAVKSYGKVILAASIINPNEKGTSESIIKRYLGMYAKVRNWPSNNNSRKLVKSAINVNSKDDNEEMEIKDLLKRRKYVVLQGAPGTGKTRMAKRLASDSKNIFFTQFHAETSYSDFIYGILPKVEATSLQYEGKEGIFVQAIRSAMNNINEDVYLIIDEINRANLANVLGPAFYLFEPTMSKSGVRIDVCPGLTLDKLPENLYVIATMNTADRSLSVVDFALRRRFAWYTMVPHEIQVDGGYTFCKEEFNEIKTIFERYATDEELSLQPGPAYFIVKKDDQEKEIDERLKYELMPLIKEYLDNGMLERSKDEFISYFRNRIHEEMYK